METPDAMRELEAMLPGGQLRELALLKRGVRADTHSALLDGRPIRAKRFRALDDYATNEAMSYRLFGTKSLDTAPHALAIASDNRWIIIDAVAGRDFTAALAAGEAPYSLMDRLGHTLATAIAATVDRAGDARIRSIEADTLMKRWPDIVRWSERLRVATPKGLDAIVAAIVDRYRDPQVVAWTQGDPAPSNVLFTPTAALLVDFEYAAYRHALHDLVQWWVRIPLPYGWYARLEQIVGSVLLQRGVYDAEATFDEDLVAMAAYAALYMFTWLPTERLLDEDLPWAPGFDGRSALLSTSNRLAARVRATHPDLADWSERVFTALSRRWPDKRTGAVCW